MNAFQLTVRSRSPGCRPLQSDGGHAGRLSDQVRLTTSGTGGDIAVSSDATSALVLHGYVAAAAGVRLGTDAAANCEALHRHWNALRDAEMRTQWLRSATGSFALVHVDLPSGEVTTVTDRLASRPLWWSRSEDELRLSSAAVQAASSGSSAGSNPLDPGGLASFLLYGTQVDPTRSFLAGVRGQREATISAYGGDGPPAESRWFRFEHRPESGRSARYWISATAEALQGSASRLLAVTRDPLVFMSGGLDSRITASALTSVGAKPLLLSLGDARNTEIKVAGLAARALGCRHVVFLRDQEHYLRVLDRSSAFADGAHVWVHGHFAEAYEHARREFGVGAGMLGDFCEAFSKLLFRMPAVGHLGDADDFLREFDRLPLPSYSPAHPERTLRLLAADVRGHAMADLRDTIRARFEQMRLVSPEQDAVGDYFFRWQSAACHVTFQMFLDLRSAGPERNLMFDTGMLDLLARMPAGIRAHARVGAHVVGKLNRAVALVPDANSLLPPGAPGFLHRFSKNMRPRLGRLKRRFFSDTYRTTASWPHLPLLMQRDPTWKRRIESMLFEGPLSTSALIDQDQVRVAWDEFREGDISRRHDLENLIGLAAVLSRRSDAATAVRA